MNEDSVESPRPHPLEASDPVPRPISPQQVILIGRPGEHEPDRVRVVNTLRRFRIRRALILFLLTCLSTFLVGFYGQPVFPHWDYVKLLRDPDFNVWRHFWSGLTYSGCVMAILTAHEMGHYLQARRYGVPASLPFFIPLPISPFGTMGAVIVQQSGVATRKSMFDIAISGPLAGLIFALPIAYWGVVNSRMEELAPTESGGIAFSSPLLLEWMMEAVHGPLPKGYVWDLNPMLFAGWVGFFITGLNLVPIGQLDGGHILYCLIGHNAHAVARGLFAAGVTAVAYSFFFGDNSFISWSLMLFLIWMFGTRHPPTANDREPLSPTRILLGWLTLMFVLIGLTPVPIVEIKPKTQAQIEQKAS